jgi:RimJ/RimL family protein N-acetyltransferase
MNMLQRWTTTRGHDLTLRPIAHTDVSAFAGLLDNLSLGTRYFRFGRLSIEFSVDELSAMCSLNSGSGRHLVVATAQNGVDILIASAHFYSLPEDGCCEMEILVADAWQGHRIAHRLLLALIQSARNDGLGHMFATVLPTNTRMIRFAQRHGFKPAGGFRQSSLKTLRLDLDSASIVV